MVTKKQIGDFNSISIFNNEYMIVERQGLYNLIDNNGNYVSKSWFEQITKNGNGADFVETKTHEKIQLRSVSLIGTYHQVRETLNNTNVLHRLDTRCISVCNPYKIHCVSLNRQIIIVAKVTILNKEYLLGKNGKLYNEDGTEFQMPNFSITLTDMNRLEEITNRFNYTYISKFDARNKALIEGHGVDRLDKIGIGVWAFGFDEPSSLEFSTSNVPFIYNGVTKAWGGNTIKVRFSLDVIPEIYHKAFISHFKAMDFAEYHKKNQDYKWWTKEYDPDEELEELFDDLEFFISHKDELREC